MVGALSGDKGAITVVDEYCSDFGRLAITSSGQLFEFSMYRLRRRRTDNEVLCVCV